MKPEEIQNKNPFLANDNFNKKTRKSNYQHYMYLSVFFD
jgi:hypothetical protein